MRHCSENVKARGCNLAYMVKAAHTIHCIVADMDRSVAFYRDILGLTPHVQSPYWSDFQLGALTIGLHPPYKGAASGPGGWILGLEVDDIRALRATLKAAGISADEPFHDVPGGVILKFEDPDGNPLQAIQTGITVADLS